MLFRLQSLVISFETIIADIFCQYLVKMRLESSGYLYRLNAVFMYHI